MKKSNIPFLTAMELSRRIKNRQVSVVETVEAYLTRIAKLNPLLNSYITVCADEALAAAARADREIGKGQYRGPMHGIPVAVKDQVLTRGIRTTAGSLILKDWVPEEDATLIIRLKRAGAIIIGKTNMTEFAITTNHHFPYGMTNNAWDLNRFAGSSSGGSASATGAFMCAASIGEDTGGSIRGPAAVSGLAGLRPTWGLVSRYGLLGAAWSMDIAGPMSRTVEDCAMTLQAIAGYDPKDDSTWKVRVPDYVRALDGGIEGLKVGVVKERIHTDDAVLEVRKAVSKAIGVLGELGAEVEEVSLSMIVHSAAFSMTICLVEGAAAHRQYIPDRLNDYQHELRLVQQVGMVIPGQTYYKAQKLREMWRQQMLDALKKYDVLVYPTSPYLASPVPPPTGLQNRADAKADLYGRRSFTHPVNLASACGLSVLCGFSESGLPIGMQIIGRPMSDAMVLRVGHTYQQATDWHTRRPPVG
jgi:aspartyl-tRNA(Asn)/glutamyl-tRNA(Gln) amidotransferase subunit A